jgi:hypothetical protein
LIWIAAIATWLAVFGTHAYYHVKLLTGQCCGYEGDPGFLLLFFIIWPGLLYFIALALILIGGLIMFVWPPEK